MTDLAICRHISCLPSGRVWVSDEKHNLILTNTTGAPLHQVKDLCKHVYIGSHAVNRESELIYIDRKYRIKTLSSDMETTSTFIHTPESSFKPRCVYWSPSTDDLLVGMYEKKRQEGKVARYNNTKKLIQTIQHCKKGQTLYSKPYYITENNNGDVVVSDFTRAVVVTERGGKYRFSYSGPTSESNLMPLGICTDPLSHILVCALVNIHMIDKDGQFLRYLPITSESNDKVIDDTYSLSYDVNTHRLWVGSQWTNKVRVYNYITKRNEKEGTSEQFLLIRQRRHSKLSINTYM